MIAADYVFQRLAAQGVGDIFMVSGGGIMHLVDALGRNPDIRHWCNHHEQACAIAAESYARVTGGIGVCLVTTGPGSTNALSGIAGAWVDSIPVLVISGQVRTGLMADYSKHRQIGPQEIDITSMARHVTKYSHTVMPGENIAAELERAIHQAITGRPGPVWFNIPLDLQNTEIDDSIAGLAASAAAADPASLGPNDGDLVAAVDMVRRAKRPLVVCGNGIHLAGAETVLRRFIDGVGCPLVATIGGMDLLDEAHPLYLGRFGPTGQRRANFALQTADLLLCVGSSMSVAAVGFDTTRFARRAKKIMVNIDPNEADKPNVAFDLHVDADAKAFMEQFLEAMPASGFEFDPLWAQAVAEWKNAYPLVTSDYLADAEHVNSYVLANRLSDLMEEGEVILTGNGMDAVSVFHSFAPKRSQRMLANSNYGAMGWDLPAAVGACVARHGARTVLMTGDGSLEMNVQELLTIGHNRMNVKVFVLNNGGYESIRATQKSFFEGRFVGCEERSGVGNPKFDSLARAFGLEYELLRVNADLDSRLGDVMTSTAPFLCEVNVSYYQEKSPKIVSRQREDGTFESCPLDDQYPFLPTEERRAVMERFSDD